MGCEGGEQQGKRHCTEDSTCVKAKGLEEAQHNLGEEAVGWAARKEIRGEVMGDEAGGLSWSKIVKIKGLWTRLKIRFYISQNERVPLKVFNQGRDITRFMFGN